MYLRLRQRDIPFEEIVIAALIGLLHMNQPGLRRPRYQSLFVSLIAGNTSLQDAGTFFKPPVRPMKSA